MAQITKTPPPFQQIANFRDVASLTSTPSHPSSLRPALFFRSAAPDDATPDDRLLLTTHYNIKTIIDLRSDTEHHEVARKNALKVPPSPDAVALPARSRASLGQPPQNLKYERINFNGSTYSNALIRQLSYPNIARLFGWYVLGHRTYAISILGENVMSKRGLVGLAQDSLTYCKAEVKTVFDVLARPEAYPVMIHCTQGKDRTGLTVLLVLMLLGAGREEIKRDYLASEQGLAADREDRIKAIASIGLGEEFAGCPHEWVDKVAGFIDEEHGGIVQYLKSCGVTSEQQMKVKGILSVRI